MMMSKPIDGVLFIDGKPLASVDDISSFEVNAMQTGESSAVLNITMEGSFTLSKCWMDPRMVLSLVTGMRITNNWLKMHGGIVVRSKAYKRAKRNINRKRGYRSGGKAR